jgi:hypothetical protein
MFYKLPALASFWTPARSTVREECDRHLRAGGAHLALAPLGTVLVSVLRPDSEGYFFHGMWLERSLPLIELATDAPGAAVHGDDSRQNLVAIDDGPGSEPNRFCGARVVQQDLVLVSAGAVGLQKVALRDLDAVDDCPDHAVAGSRLGVMRAQGQSQKEKANRCRDTARKRHVVLSDGGLKEIRVPKKTLKSP